MLKYLENRSVFDIVNIVAGLGLALSPWLLGFAAESYPAWNAWLVGAAVVLVAGVTLFAFHQYEEWANLAFGLWATIAPWVLGFAGMSVAMGAHVVAGLIIAVMAAVRLWSIHNTPFSAA